MRSNYLVTGDVTQADVVAIGAVSAQFSNIVAMAAGETYVFTATVACYIKQGSNPTASAAAGSALVPAGIQILIDGAIGAKLAVIQASGAGTASLVRAKVQ